MLDNGKSVLVCAPTGSGKTAIAEYVIHKAIAENKKIFYTTPLKALSNQKFFDLSQLLGESKVGLLTGDVQVNREAEVIVLTTEIFRNMLYKSEEERDLLERMGYLVLDECHYMQNADRGTVWEESIIYCPPQTQIIGLSATIGNPEKLSQWINETHGPTELITSDTRPVPLRFFFFGKDGIMPINTPEGKLNKRLLTKQGNKKSSNNNLPKINDVIAELQSREMLPVIYFLFSRKGCEVALKRLQHYQYSLLSPEESSRLDQELKQACKQLPWLRFHQHFYFLKRGVAAHHAGLLPALKSLIERLFQKNLVKVVFATETLAAGVNMPARSVVISQISKRAESGHRLLTGSEFLQMSGRAGRRGMDKIGYATVLETRFEGAWEICQLASTPSEDLHSSFTPSYVMVLNLAARYSWEQCKDIVLKSFARFEISEEIKSLLNTKNQLKKTLEKKRTDPAKSKKTEKKLEKLNRELAQLELIPWPDFERSAEVLMKFEYMNTNFQPTPKGIWAADIRGDNILFLSEIIHSKILDKLTPYELCGFVCSLTSYEARWKQNNPNSKSWAITEEIEKTARDIFEIVKRIAEVQNDCDLMVKIPFTPSFIELGFDWACNYEWQELLDKYKADEGDLVKIIKQASDLLKQITVCRGSSLELINNANKAFDLIYRTPIKDELSSQD